MMSTEDEPELRKGYCANCHQPILITIFMGGAWCSGNCRKALGKDSNKYTP